MFSDAEENFRHFIRQRKCWRRDARGNLTSGQLRCFGISSASASPCSMLIQRRFAFLNLHPSLRIDESQEELPIPQSLDCKQTIVSLTRHRRPAGRDPTARRWSPERRGVGRRNGEALVAGTARRWSPERRGVGRRNGEIKECRY